MCVVEFILYKNISTGSRDIFTPDFPIQMPFISHHVHFTDEGTVTSSPVTCIALGLGGNSDSLIFSLALFETHQRFQTQKINLSLTFPEMSIGFAGGLQSRNCLLTFDHTFLFAISKLKWQSLGRCPSSTQ